MQTSLFISVVTVTQREVGLNNRNVLFLFCLVAAVTFGVLGVGQGSCAQSQPDLEPPSEAGGVPAPEKSAETSVLRTPMDQVNYAIGVNLIGNFKKQGVDIDLNLVMKGMQDAFAGNKLLLSDAEFGRAIKQYQAEVRRMRGKIITQEAEENKKAGEKFLLENMKKEGVVTLPSGLQYQILKSGEGKKPTASDSVECHYRGKLLNGKEFDSSFRLGHPVTFKVNSVIAGWGEALKLMPVGSTWKIFIPSPLAYGDRGASGAVGANATLIFEVELLAIK
jgi:FKBP-type peptidyl-prolyl cis-trans isomerase